MKVSDEVVAKIAKLSKLEFKGERLEAIKSDLNRMIDFVDKLDELDTENVEPLIHMTDESNVLREDVAKHELKQADALKNGPDTDSDYFRVPKVLK